MDGDAISSLENGTGNGKGSSTPRDGCVKCDGNHIQRHCPTHVTPRKGNDDKGKSWSNVLAQERAHTRLRMKFKGSKSATGSHNGKSSKIGVSGVENQREVKRHVHRRFPLTILTLTVRGLVVAGVTTNGMMIGDRLAGIVNSHAFPSW